jgi:heptaprenyl diphosphate synthase
MAASCRVGALTAQHSADVVDAFTTYGHCFGMIYQLRDDILDMIATDGQLGKPAGQDLAEGVYNLPTLVALRDASTGAELRALLGKPLNDDEREIARQLVVGTNGIAETIKAANNFFAKANDALALVDESVRSGLSSLLASLLEDLPAY